MGRGHGAQRTGGFAYAVVLLALAMAFSLIAVHAGMRHGSSPSAEEPMVFGHSMVSGAADAAAPAAVTPAASPAAQAAAGGCTHCDESAESTAMACLFMLLLILVAWAHSPARRARAVRLAIRNAVERVRHTLVPAAPDLHVLCVSRT